MKAEEQAFVEKLALLEEKQLLREYFPSESLAGGYIKITGKKLISFGCNDYFGLSTDKEMIKAANAATIKYGAGAGASRLLSGNNILYDQLESLVAKVKGFESAAVFGSGYLANIGVISAIAGVGDLIVADKLVHACVIDGAKLSGVKLLRFSHNSTENLIKILEKNRKNYKNCIIITESIFSMDGDKAPLADIHKIAKKYNALLVVDDAHSIDFRNQAITADICIGTFSKALGSYGGYVAASKAVIKYIKTASRSMMFSTALPPGVLAANLKALQISSKKDFANKILENANKFCKILGLEKPQSAIVPVIIGDNKKTLEIAKKLLTNNIYVPAIRPPTVPPGTSRLRFSFSAIHKEQDIVNSAFLVKALL